MHIPFNIPPRTGNEAGYVKEAMRSGQMSGDGEFSRKCEAWFQERLQCPRTLLMPSCTAALEAAAILLDIQPGDEVIMPSYTFPSTANAFVLRGASLVFVDIRPDTMNLDESLIEAAITSRTRAIVVVHYAGVSCDMNSIMALAEKHELPVVEDAAQAVLSEYEGHALGTLGQLGAYSFHETKNYSSGGEGGLLLVNDPALIERAEIIREKGTNRSHFFRGMVDKYSWVDLGSSYLLNELCAAYLWGQLESADNINEQRLACWLRYYEALSQLQDEKKLALPQIPQNCRHNAHMFYIKAADLEERNVLLDELNRQGITAIFHYVPLHSSQAGKRFGRFHGSDRYTTLESERLLRLPMYYGLDPELIDYTTAAIRQYYR